MALRVALVGAHGASGGFPHRQPRVGRRRTCYNRTPCSARSSSFAVRLASWLRLPGPRTGGERLASHSRDDTEDPNDLPRRERIRRHWTEKQVPRFWIVVNEELMPEVLSRLERRFRYSGLTREDFEDCWQETLWPFINGQADSVGDPELYVKRAVRNACIDEIRSQRRRRAAQTELQTEFTRLTGMRPGRPRGSGGADEPDGEDVQIDRASATVLAEELVGELGADVTWVPAVVHEALSRIRPALRRVVAYVMEHGPDVRDEDAATDLGMKPKSYRSNKSKAFTILKQVIPAVIREFGIVPSRGAQEAIFLEEHDLASTGDEGAS